MCVTERGHKLLGVTSQFLNRRRNTQYDGKLSKRNLPLIHLDSSNHSLSPPKRYQKLRNDLSNVHATEKSEPQFSCTAHSQSQAIVKELQICFPKSP